MTTKIPVELSSTPSIVDNGDATAITIDSSENVGIGATSPQSRLEITPPDNSTANKIIFSHFSARGDANDVIAGGIESQFRTRDANVNTGAFIRILDKNTNSSFPTQIRGGEIVFGTMDGATGFANNPAVERMRLTTSGNLLIGATSSNNKLQVEVSGNNGTYADADNPLFLKNSSTTDGATVGQYFGCGNGVGVVLTAHFANASATGKADFTIATRNPSNSMAEAMRITSGGNFLLGTTDTSYSSGPGFKFTPSATNPINGMVVNTSTGNASNFHFYNMNASYSGFRWYIHANGGTINYAGNNVNLSDEKVKTNIELSGNYLEKICNIPVKLFNYKDEPEDKDRSLGVIAQDVEAVAPELVNNDGFGETPEDGVPLKTVYTTDMMYALMKAIQEQQAIIEDLQTQINEVKNGN